MTSQKNQPPERDGAVTVVIPCYNYGRYLAGAVRAALDQGELDVRVIIVDDASPDGSGAVADELAAGDRRVSVIRHAVNRGHIQTYADGFAAVETEFVTLVSADDLVAPGALERAASLMNQHPNVGLVYGPVGLFEDVPPVRVSRRRASARVVDGRQWGRRVVRRAVNPIRSPEAVVRTSALRQAGDYDPSLPHSADLEYWLRICARWDVGVIAHATQAYYRVHGGNMHLTTFKDAALEREQLYAALKPFLENVAPEETVRAQRAVTEPALRVVERLTAVQRVGGDADALVSAVDRIWPEWRSSRRWRPLGESLERRRSGAGPTPSLRVIAWVPGQVDRVRNRLARAVRDYRSRAGET